MAYEKTVWVSKESADFVEGSSPALDATHLNKIEDGISRVDEVPNFVNLISQGIISNINNWISSTNNSSLVVERNCEGSVVCEALVWEANEITADSLSLGYGSSTITFKTSLAFQMSVLGAQPACTPYSIDGSSYNSEYVDIVIAPNLTWDSFSSNSYAYKCSISGKIYSEDGEFVKMATRSLSNDSHNDISIRLSNDDYLWIMENNPVLKLDISFIPTTEKYYPSMSGVKLSPKVKFNRANRLSLPFVENVKVPTEI